MPEWQSAPQKDAAGTFVSWSGIRHQSLLRGRIGGLLLAIDLGGARRDRTAGLLLAKQALSQLSYSPMAGYWWVWVDLNHRPHPYQGCALTN